METIFSYLARDHAHCSALFAQLSAHVRDGEWTQAQRAMNTLADALTRHLRIEEQLVFKPFDEMLHLAPSPTGALCVEHERIAGVLERVEQAVLMGDPVEYWKHATTLRLVLMLHFEKEQAGFYPLVQCVLAPQMERLSAAVGEFLAPARLACADQ
jgi:hypothetical protein